MPQVSILRVFTSYHIPYTLSRYPVKTAGLEPAFSHVRGERNNQTFPRPAAYICRHAMTHDDMRRHAYVLTAGFEPTTSRESSERSTSLSYVSKALHCATYLSVELHAGIGGATGARGDSRIRTCGGVFKSRFRFRNGRDKPDSAMSPIMRGADRARTGKKRFCRPLRYHSATAP